MKKWLSIAGLIVLLVGCANNANMEENNETPANTVPRDTEEIQNDAEQDFQGRDIENRINENNAPNNEEANDLNDNPQVEIIENLNRENDVD